MPSHFSLNHFFLLPSQIYQRARTDSQNAARSVGAGSPRGNDLYRAGPRHSQKHTHGHHHRRETGHRHARKKAFNPFRQADEDKVLAKISHNRRRWSHVFPKGEIEFKRHAGPIWKSLTSPAVLPLSVDYFPSRSEIDQYFQFNIYNVTLIDFENTHYSTHAELLMEMVRQRITQDYQLVPPSYIDETIYRGKPLVGHGKCLVFVFCLGKERRNVRYLTYFYHS